MEMCTIAQAMFTLLTRSGQRLILPAEAKWVCRRLRKPGPTRCRHFRRLHVSLPSPWPSWCPHSDLEECRTLEVTVRNLMSVGGEVVQALRRSKGGVERGVNMGR